MTLTSVVFKELFSLCQRFLILCFPSTTVAVLVQQVDWSCGRFRLTPHSASPTYHSSVSITSYFELWCKSSISI